MTMYVYSTAGEPRGFLFETTVYGLDGTPLGRVLGCRVHRFDGSYGRIFDVIVLGRPDTTRGRPSMMTIEAGLFETGRPILIASPGRSTWRTFRYCIRSTCFACCCACGRIASGRGWTRYSSRRRRLAP